MAPSLQTVQDLPLFTDLSDADCERILGAGTLRSLAKGEQLFMHGEMPHAFYVLVEGAVRQFRETPDGKEITVGLAVKGDLIGATHLFESTTAFQWSAAAAEPSLLFVYDMAWFKREIASHNTLSLNLLAALSKQTHLAMVDAEHLVTLTAPQRIACFLLRLCALYGFDPRHFELPYSKTTIASKLGMELETFSRSLKKLQAAGISVHGSQVQVSDLHMLECFACGHCSISEDCATITKLHETGCGGPKHLA